MGELSAVHLRPREVRSARLREGEVGAGAVPGTRTAAAVLAGAPQLDFISAALCAIMLGRAGAGTWNVLLVLILMLGVAALSAGTLLKELR